MRRGSTERADRAVVHHRQMLLCGRLLPELLHGAEAVTIKRQRPPHTARIAVRRGWRSASPFRAHCAPCAAWPRAEPVARETRRHGWLPGASAVLPARDRSSPESPPQRSRPRLDRFVVVATEISVKGIQKSRCAGNKYGSAARMGHSADRPGKSKLLCSREVMPRCGLFSRLCPGQLESEETCRYLPLPCLPLLGHSHGHLSASSYRLSMKRRACRMCCLEYRRR